MSQPVDNCLQCGQTRAEVKANDTFCATVTGYEVIETNDEWERHHWRDWSDAELRRHGIEPSLWNAHRRTDIYGLEFPFRESICIREGHSEPVPDYWDEHTCPCCYVNLTKQREAGQIVAMKEEAR